MSMNPAVKYNTVVYRSNNHDENAPNNSGVTAGDVTKRNNYKQDAHDATSSILSDYEELDLLGGNDDQSLYILFNPVRTSSVRNESDILSFTNTTAEDEEQEQEQGQEQEEQQEHEEKDEQYKEDDEKQEIVQATVQRIPNTDLSESNLSNKINNWYNSNVYSSDDMFVDDNIASWNLDENLMDHSKEGMLEVYGSDLFKYLDKEDLAKFKRFHHLTDIKTFLLSKGDVASTTSATAPNTILNQLILKLILATRGQQKSHVEHVPTKSYTPAYINHMSQRSYQPEFVSPSTFSDTTGGSSLILCGGVGFGGSSSWNEL